GNPRLALLRATCALAHHLEARLQRDRLRRLVDLQRAKRGCARRADEYAAAGGDDHPDRRRRAAPRRRRGRRVLGARRQIAAMRTFAARDATRALTPTGGFLKGFAYSLNPYIGCAFGVGRGCPFCYVRALPVARASEGAW